MKPIAVHELAAADARLKVAQQPWFDSLSEDERQALAAYKGRAGRAMNRALSGEPERQDLIVSAGYLRAALARACAPADMLVYRGVGQAEAAHYRALAQGYTVQARAFVSTSLSAEQAARSAQVQGGSVVELVIRRGRKGVAYVNPFPTYRYPQFEVLVNAGSVLKMLRANDAAIRLEVGPPGDWR